MSNFLGNLLGRAEHSIQNVEHAAGNAINNAVHGGQAAPASTASPQQTSNAVNNINKATGFSPSRFVPDYSGAYPAQPQAPFAGPSATSAPIPSFIGNQYANNPQGADSLGRQFFGPTAVDPMIFGYPADGPPIPQAYGPNATDSHTMDAIQQATGFPNNSQNQILQGLLNR